MRLILTVTAGLAAIHYRFLAACIYGSHVHSHLRSVLDFDHRIFRAIMDGIMHVVRMLVVIVSQPAEKRGTQLGGRL